MNFLNKIEKFDSNTCFFTEDKRRESYQDILPDIKGGYQKMYVDHVMQADKGADLDFLVGKRGSEVFLVDFLPKSDFHKNFFDNERR